MFKNPERVINKLVSSFNFKAAARTYRTMGWTIYDKNPEIERLQKVARRVLHSAIEIAEEEGLPVRYASWGIEARIQQFPGPLGDGTPTISLALVRFEQLERLELDGDET